MSQTFHLRRLYIAAALVLLMAAALSCRLPFSGMIGSGASIPDTEVVESPMPTSTTPADATPQTATAAAGNETVEPVDERPATGFKDLIERGVEEERWTRGEGILHVMEVLAGEREMEEKVLYPEGTLAYGLAEEYIANGEDEAIKNRLEELIQQMYGAVKNVEHFAVPAEEYSGSGGNKLAAQAAQGATDSCGDLWVDAFPKTDKITCFLSDQVQAGGVTLQVFYPLGWKGKETPMEVVETSLEVLKRSAETYARFGENQDMAVVFSLYPDPNDESNTGTAVYPKRWFRETCPIVIHMNPVNYYQDIYKDTVAHEAFHCFQYKNFFDNQNLVGNASNNTWWMEGTAVHFSNVAVPEIDTDKLLVPNFDKRSQLERLTEMAYENFVFFTDWMNHRGNQDLIAFLHFLSVERSSFYQMDEMAEYPHMEDYFHAFGERYMDKNIPHPGGGMLPIPASLNEEEDVDKPMTVFAEDIQPFTLYRIKAKYLPDRRYFQEMTYEHKGQTTTRKDSEPGTWENVKDKVYFRCEEYDPYLVLVTSATKELYHHSEMTVTKVEEAACDGCLLGDWAVQKDSFLSVYNRIAEETAPSAQVEILDMAGTMGAHFEDDHFFRSVDNGLQVVMRTTVPGQGEMDLTWRIDSVGKAEWFTDIEMTSLTVTETDLVADVTVSLPGMGEFSLSDLSGMSGMGEMGDLFALDAGSFAVGNIVTTSSGQSRPYTCGEETLTLHYPQYGDLVMDRLDKPVPLPDISGSAGGDSNP